MMVHNEACHPGDDYWNYYSGALSLSHVIAPHLEIGHPKISSTGTRSVNEWQRLDYVTGWQGSSPNKRAW